MTRGSNEGGKKKNSHARDGSTKRKEGIRRRGFLRIDLARRINKEESQVEGLRILSSEGGGRMYLRNEPGGI